MKNCSGKSLKGAGSQALSSHQEETGKYGLKFAEIVRKKNLSEITAADVPRGLSPKDVAIEES